MNTPYGAPSPNRGPYAGHDIGVGPLDDIRVQVAEPTDPHAGTVWVSSNPVTEPCTDCGPNPWWEQAFQIINALSGGRLVANDETIYETHRHPGIRYTLGGQRHKGGCGCGCCVHLYVNYRADKFLEVADDAGCPVDWYPINSRTIAVCTPVNCNSCGELTVAYVVKSNVGGIVGEAINALADELLKASNGQPCSLPERVTSVSRQGVSWTLLDPHEFFDKGRTGIYKVDLALSSLNPSKAVARARVFSPEKPPATRNINGPVSRWSTGGTP